MMSLKNRMGKPVKTGVKKPRGLWNDEDMIKAITDIVDKGVGVRKASKTYKVPKSTLQRKLKQVQKGSSIEECASIVKAGPKPVFTREQIQELVDTILMMEKRFFPFSSMDIRQLVYELADKDNLPNTFNTVTKLAGVRWLRKFYKENPQIKSDVRTPRATLLAKAHGFNEVSVAAFFDALKEIYDKYNIPPDRIYNVDYIEASASVSDAKKQAGTAVSGEVSISTITVCMSAAGVFMPLMFIFAKEHIDEKLLHNALPGSFAEFDEAGWMRKKTFIKWIHKFIEFANPSSKRPVLLLLNGHTELTKNAEFLNLIKTNHIVLLSFPPKCSDKMQPLDISLMALMKTYYAEEVARWHMCNTGKNLTVYEIAEIVGLAYMKVANIQTAINGFKNTGIYPFNPNVFAKCMFAPLCTITVTPEVAENRSSDSGSRSSDDNEEHA